MVELPRGEVPREMVEVPRNEVPREMAEMPRNEVTSEMVELPRGEVPREMVEVPKELDDEDDGLGLLPASQTAPFNLDMPPPPTPTVTLQPPTPHTSQEAAASGPTTLLKVPEDLTVVKVTEPGTNLPESSIPQSGNTRSRSTSIADAEPRRSPRLQSRSPTPIPSIVPQKRKSDRSGEPLGKKPRED
jgi:hypothetical protein